jgi:ABC-2 type transport system ATP-binding protein
MGDARFENLIAELREKGTTVFMSTHILSDIEALCDQVAILRNGKAGGDGKFGRTFCRKAARRKFTK